MTYENYAMLMNFCHVSCWVVVVQVEECVINDLGTIVVVVVVVAVVVELYADIHNESFHTHALLRAHALEC